ncbi:hypothetical protein H310_07250 [Aphanomyces invadans]|uniref:EF-hand domain-containing protein n=1 Tax=Aphanomyces invadans TaxID=157072 RepID=A0A024U2M7_9STRA|nr:hypothetical protein H310_07250 [Aphanomyces invadans]ETW00691.1 hypothetical protein H310_07250 [Aphanomyces invadans]|eukprot:XP_008870826.1 hypothetical protein H310_07250 [Aphanomyces invadans]
MTAQLRNADAAKILQTLRGKLSAKGSQQLSDLRLHFAQMDRHGEGLLGRKEVDVCLNYFGLFPSTQDVGTLMRVYGTGHAGTATPQLAWVQFMDALEFEMPPTRQEAVRLAYDSIGRRSNNRFSIESLTALGQFDQHPLALRGITPAAELAREFAIGLAKAVSTHTVRVVIHWRHRREFDQLAQESVTFDAFKASWKLIINWHAMWQAYYLTVSHATPRDDDFLSMIQCVWSVDELKIVPQMPLFGGYKEALCRKLDEKTHGADMPRDVLLRALKKFDTEETGFLSQTEFAQAIEIFGFTLTPAQLNGTQVYQTCILASPRTGGCKDTFQRGDTNKANKLRLEWFANFVCS